MTDFRHWTFRSINSAPCISAPLQTPVLSKLLKKLKPEKQHGFVHFSHWSTRSINY